MQAFRNFYGIIKAKYFKINVSVSYQYIDFIEVKAWFRFLRKKFKEVYVKICIEKKDMTVIIYIHVDGACTREIYYL